MMDKGTALVIGGSRGIGGAIAVKLAQLGFDIVFSCREVSEAALSTRDEILGQGRNCEIITFDLADRNASTSAINELLARLTPHVAVYNAGITRDNLFALMSEQEWAEVMRVNLDGFFYAFQPVVFNMIAAKRGRVIVVSSASGQAGQAGQVNYSASKAGLIGAAKALAKEIGRKNVFVNVVAPGVIETEMTSAMPKDKILPLIPLGRFGRADEVASIVGFLAAEEKMYIHGQVIGVNGGLLI
ncbi:MAG: 3-oxoacyl-ACP reductase [Lentisphaerae bacterium GWF2_52_8]|nr:MAG: 3-oxoacyl-ACP reductase [Lentisphaerae bacterium GWF2_52_8]